MVWCIVPAFHPFVPQNTSAMILRTALRYGFALAALAGLHTAQANNIQVSNTTLTGNGGGMATIQFDISWENSWRGGGVNNWDAAWVFVKYKLANGIWYHAVLEEAGHITPSGSQIDLGRRNPLGPTGSNDVVGVYIRRDADGTGSFAANGVGLQWEFLVDGMPVTAFSDITEVRVHALEVVYVNEGAFAVGTGGGEPGSFELTTIGSMNPLFTPVNPGSLGGLGGGHPTGQTPPHSTYPNGVRAFYCLKYEVSQRFIADFLNSLTVQQQDAILYPPLDSPAGTPALSASNTYRQGLVITKSGNQPTLPVTTPVTIGCNLNGNTTYDEPDDGADLPVSNLTWPQLLAFLDWSALRPMTEMEYEKVARGPLPPTPNGYAWGAQQPTLTPYTISDPGTANESISGGFSEANAIWAFNDIGGPLRVGIFAAHPSNTGRATSGASYYGCMELTGNLWEPTIGMDHASGRAYAETHGNGVITATGTHDVDHWPAETGRMLRGGSFDAIYSDLYISSRFPGYHPGTNRSIGVRGVRTAP